MRKWLQEFVQFLKAEDGPTAVEYAVMLALIVVVCLVAITAMGTAANKTLETSLCKQPRLALRYKTFGVGCAWMVDAHRWQLGEHIYLVWSCLCVANGS